MVVIWTSRTYAKQRRVISFICIVKKKQNSVNATQYIKSKPLEQKFHTHMSQKFSRVDALKTFSAVQLWFKNVSVQIQRYSEFFSYWTALIQLWSALKNQFSELQIRAEQPSFSLIQLRIALVHDGFRITIFASFSILKKNCEAPQFWRR